MIRRAGDIVLLAVLLGATIATFGPILGNYFYGDDFVDLQAIVDAPLGYFLLQPFAGHVLVVRSFVFWLTHAIAGTKATVYFASVLVTHLLNATLLLLALRRLTSPAIALLASTLWAVAPVQEGALGWYAAFGHPLATVPIAVILLDLTRRPTGSKLSEAVIWAYCGLLLAAAGTFGVGIAVALVFPIALRVLLGPDAYSRRAKAVLATFPAVIVCGYLLLHRLYDALYQQDAESGLRAIVAGLQFWWVPIAMFGHLLLVGPVALLGGHLLPFGEYPSGRTLAFGAGFWAFVAGALFIADRRRRRWVCFALLLSGACYAMIAVGRAVLYAILTRRPAYGAMEARYHYAPTLCLAVAFAIAAETYLRQSGRHADRLAWTLAAAWGAVLLAAGVRSGWHIDPHAEARRATDQARAELGAAAATARPGAPAVLANRPFPPAQSASIYFAGLAGVYMIFFPDDPERPVLFIEENEALRGRVLAGTRLARILIPPPVPHSTVP